MNKITVLVLVLALALTLTASAESMDLTGTWVLEKVLVEDTELNPAVLGISITLELKDDGTFVFSGSTRETDTENTDQNIVGTWAIENDFLALTNREDSSVINGSYSAEDDRLVISDEMSTIVLGREGEVVVEGPELPPSPVAAEGEEAFFGTWRMCATSFSGIYLPLPDNETNETLILDSGTCIMIVKDPNTGELVENVLNTRFRDGGLGLYNYEYSYEVTTPGTLWLTDDGTLCLTTDYDFTYYFSRVE